MRVIDQELRNLLYVWLSQLSCDLRVLLLTPYRAQQRMLAEAVVRVQAATPPHARRTTSTRYKCLLLTAVRVRRWTVC